MPDRSSLETLFHALADPPWERHFDQRERFLAETEHPTERRRP